MVSQSGEEKPPYRIIFHSNAQSDLQEINVGWHESIYDSIEHKLGQAPKFFGEPIKQSHNLLWRTRHSKVRIIYTFSDSEREVIVLSVKKREITYEPRHLVKLLRLAEEFRRK